jgi:hypothetical protein
LFGPHRPPGRSYELAKKIERKKLSIRDENRHLEIRKDVNFKVSALIDRYTAQYAIKKKSYEREKSILEGIGRELGTLFVREVDGLAVDRWYQKLTGELGLSVGTAVRHFNVMHHMMAKAATIWSKDTGIDRNPADQVEIRRPNDQRDRYLSAGEIQRLNRQLTARCTGRRTRASTGRFCACVCLYWLRSRRACGWARFST